MRPLLELALSAWIGSAFGFVLGAWWQATRSEAHRKLIARAKGD